MTLIEIQNENSFRHALHAGMNLFAGAGFSFCREIHTVDRYHLEIRSAKSW